MGSLPWPHALLHLPTRHGRGQPAGPGLAGGPGRAPVPRGLGVRLPPPDPRHGLALHLDWAQLGRRAGLGRPQLPGPGLGLGPPRCLGGGWALGAPLGGGAAVLGLPAGAAGLLPPLGGLGLRAGGLGGGLVAAAP